jgi:Peptidase propeptide and YPEB domain
MDRKDTDMRKRLLKIGAVVVVLGALAGGGVAWGTAGDDDENVTGTGADRAKAAALAYVGDGQVVGVEQEGEGGATWEVEIERTDGSTVEVALDENYKVLGSGAEEDDDGPDDEDAGESED